MRKFINFLLILTIVIIVVIYKGPDFLNALRTVTHKEILPGIVTTEFDENSAYSICVAAGKTYATNPEDTTFRDLDGSSLREVDINKHTLSIPFSTGAGGHATISCNFMGNTLESYSLYK
ncbi:hypothetical protein [Paenibacillus illinoisensis]|uniref:hypothetical protein n=1 Tax=Paenibacillus illinoisensis TaxID=59845 RepID=UPI00203EF6CA|nr:hypothetical protein [Paenibacillus illinoisensis]MCM3206408.1 hypothetical protein [Paenibacillus illinoisensis]